MRRYVLSTFLFFLLLDSQSQDRDGDTWRRIDSLISDKKDLSVVYDLVQQFRLKALAEKKYLRAGRCYYYQILVTDLRTEDSAWFRNSAFIDSLLMTQQDKKELQWVMHMLLAKRLRGFTTRYLRFNRQRYERNDIPINYAAFSNNQLDSIAQYHFEEAKKIIKGIGSTDVADALWLSSDPLLFLFKPGLFDIVIAEQIYHLKKRYYGFPPWSKQTNLMKLSPDDFIEKMDSLYQADKESMAQLKIYREWLIWHRTTPSTYYFIETLARKFIHQLPDLQYDTDEAVNRYGQYLERIVSSPYTPVKAHGVYQLCLLWNQQSKKYFPSGDYEYSYRSNKEKRDYDTVYRYHALKAIQLFEQNKNMLDSFGYLKNILLRVEGQILQSDMNMSMEEHNLPDEPILAELSYKNADKLYYRIVRMNKDFAFGSKTRKENINRLQQYPEVMTSVVDLSLTNDHNKHGVYLKLNPLSVGSYAVLFSHQPLTDSNKNIEHLLFKVSYIALVKNDSRFFVLDRKTGFPLTGAKIRGYYRHGKADTAQRKPLHIKDYLVNGQGFAIVNKKKIDAIEVCYKNDTVYSIVEFNQSEDDESENVYNKKDYDDLVEFYEENATTHIFTDRSIYRPGQTVYFKAIFLTKDRNTGEAMVMSNANMGSSVFRNVYKKWLKESEPLLYFTNPFNREVDSIKIRPNEYGSVSGSFKIPKTAATGEWTIEPDYIENEGRAGSIQVEEYKRPSYEISIEKPKKELLPADTFSVKVKVKSFAGAALNNVLINYNITRRGTLPSDDDQEGDMLTEKIAAHLVDTFAYTNAEGELSITVNDLSLKKYSLPKDRQWNFTYDINAEAIDVTGENYEAETSVTISSRPISIALPFVENYNRSEKNNVLITASDKNAGKVFKEVRIKIYRLLKAEKPYSDRKLGKADQWLYNKEQLQQWFPLINIFNVQDTGIKKIVLEKTINTGKGEKLDIDPALFTAGSYLVEASCEENGNLLGENEKYFAIYDEKENKLPGTKWSFSHLKMNTLFPKDTVKFYSGNTMLPVYAIYHITWYAGKKKTSINQSYDIIKQDAGLHVFRWKVPANAVDQALVTQVYVINNEVFTHEERIYIAGNAVAEPEIIIEQYRKKLSPGSKETFSIAIKTKNENTAAELMTTLYDASLDKLEPHRWSKPRKENDRYLDTDWGETINSTTRSVDFFNSEKYREQESILQGYAKPVWWINGLDSGTKAVSDRGNLMQVDMTSYERRAGAGRLAAVATGVMFDTQGLDEVVVVGYSTGYQRVTGSYSMLRGMNIRGMSTLTPYSQPLIILDGFPYTGDLSKLNPGLITQAMVFKGADAASIWGAQAANGILVLSTKGDIVLPTLPPEPTLPPRKNFNETAFFFPNVYADKDGYYRFSFTMPESVTEWNWKLLAHTKKAQFAYAERKLNTQLPLMVQPNMPRLLYQGDRIVLQSRISNLDTLDAMGKATCRIEDAVTGEEITSAWLAKTGNDFSVAKKANVSSAFDISVPKTQLNPIKIIISVRSQNFSDGEEHIIPVLSSKILVRENIPFRFSKNTDTVLPAVALPAEAELYGVGLSILPKPQSALLNALPWLANYSYDCAEQTFNKLLANVTALKIMRTDKEGQRSFEKAKETIEKHVVTREQLPDELSEQAMPWLAAGNKTIITQRQLFELLDTSRTEPQIRKHLDKLYKLQNADGGLTWFEGGKSNTYISDYVLAGFGKLTKDNQLVPEKLFDQKYTDFISKLLVYCQGNFQNAMNEKALFNDPLMYLYARSFWKEKYSVTDSSVQGIRTLLTERWVKADRNSLHGQSMLIITTLRYFDKKAAEYQRAIQQLNSIEQLAIRDDVNGVRWKDLADNDDMSNTAEETLVLIAEAFSEAGVHPQLSQGMIKWLLTAKNEDHWSSTKATSAVINMLSRQDKAVTGITQSIHSTVNSKELSVTDDLLNGTGFSFVRENKPSPVALKKQANTDAAGSLTWYYFSAGEFANNVNKQVNLKKEVSRFNQASGKWEPVNEKTILRIADKIKVLLTIETPKALRYVYVDDKRAAAFEPKENHSGYRYNEGIGYYQSIRDAGTQFFTDFIPAGRTVISYEMTVAHEGSFSNGPASLQCMYKPEVTAYSNSMVVQTIK